MSDWIDGPKLVAWLKLRGFQARPHFVKYAHRIEHWQKGGRANVYTVDDLLTRLGYHLSELPEDFWTAPPRYGNETSPEVQDEIARRAVEGEPVRKISAELSVGRKTVERYAKAAVR